MILTFRGGRAVKQSRFMRLYQSRKRELFDLLGSQCAFCGSTERLTFDHIRPADWPRNKYSSHERLRLYLLEAKIGNIQVLCHSCNASKGARQFQRPLPL